MESRKLIALLLAPALLCSGCSMLWVRGPKEVDPSAPPSTALPECSTSRGLPTLDIVLGALSTAGAAAAFVGAGMAWDTPGYAKLPLSLDLQSDNDYYREYVSEQEGIATLLTSVGIVAVVEAATMFISGGMGNSNVTACREARAQHAARQSVPNPLLMAAQGRAVPTPVPLAPATPRFGSECTHDAECAVPNICTYGHCVENGGRL